MLKMNYQMKHAVNLFGGNITSNPDIIIFTDTRETG